MTLAHKNNTHKSKIYVYKKKKKHPGNFFLQILINFIIVLKKHYITVFFKYILNYS
jgi:hypothetical protein